jgi:hypothetical protein
MTVEVSGAPDVHGGTFTTDGSAHCEGQQGEHHFPRGDRQREHARAEAFILDM